MSRVQLSINVSDFDPPLELVLTSPGNGPGGTISHLGVEVAGTGKMPWEYYMVLGHIETP